MILVHKHEAPTNFHRLHTETYAEERHEVDTIREAKPTSMYVFVKNKPKSYHSSPSFPFPLLSFHFFIVSFNQVPSKHTSFFQVYSLRCTSFLSDLDPPNSTLFTTNDHSSSLVSYHPKTTFFPYCLHFLLAGLVIVSSALKIPTFCQFLPQNPHLRASLTHHLEATRYCTNPYLRPATLVIGAFCTEFKHFKNTRPIKSCYRLLFLPKKVNFPATHTHTLIYITIKPLFPLFSCYKRILSPINIDQY